MKNDRENERGWRRVKKLKKWTICMNFVGVGRCSRVGWLVAMTTTPVSWWSTPGPDPFILLASPTQRPTPTRPTVVSCHALIRTLLPIPLIPMSAIQGYGESDKTAKWSSVLSIVLRYSSGIHIISSGLEQISRKVWGLGKKSMAFLLGIDLLIGLVFLLIDLSEKNS